MKRFRVYYAGQPASAVLLDAQQPAEAAYAFFANQPERNSIFVAIDGTFREWTFSVDELARRYPDVPSILEHLVGEKDVIKSTLDQERRMEKAPGIESPVGKYFLHRLVLGAVGALVLGAFTLINALRDETASHVVTCAEFQAELPRSWSIYRDIITPNGVHLVKMEDERHSLLNIYVYAKGTGPAPAEILESIRTQVEPLLEREDARIALGEVSVTQVFGHSGATQPFTIEKSGSRKPHTWHAVNVPFATHDICVLVQFPDSDKRSTEADAATIIASIAPVGKPAASAKSSGLPNGFIHPGACILRKEVRTPVIVVRPIRACIGIG